jgi:hypothetical protein
MKLFIGIALAALLATSASAIGDGVTFTGVSEFPTACFTQYRLKSFTSPAYGTWGFSTFTIPGNSQTVTAGGTDTIDDAITALAGGGGTVTLEAGEHTVTEQVMIPSNVVIEGSDTLGTTIVAAAAYRSDHAILRTANYSENIIIRNLIIDADTTTDGNNGIEVTHGISNVLIEDIKIFGAIKSNIGIWDNDGYFAGALYNPSRITVQRVETYNAGIHGISARLIVRGTFDDIEAYGNGGYGIDISTSDFIEVANSYVHGNDYGTKSPRTIHYYMHDTIIEDNLGDPLTGSEVGIKLTGWANCEYYHHFENVTVTNSGYGALEFADAAVPSVFAEIVVKGSIITVGTNQFDYWRLLSGTVHTFGDQVYVDQDDDPPGEYTYGNMNVTIYDSGDIPATEGVGYLTW